VPAFATELARLRRWRRMSQSSLSTASGVSRHISFLESGRALPGASTVRRLSQGLQLDFAAENALFASGGYAATRGEPDWTEARFSPARSAIAALFARHEPFPALLVQRNGNILQQNQGFTAALKWAFGARSPWATTDCGGQPNIFRLTLHPQGLARFMLNPEDIVPHTLRRLEQAAAGASGAGSLIAACRRFPIARQYGALSETEASRAASVVVERYTIRGETLSLVTMVASFGSPEDVTSQSIQVELYFPEDAATASLFERLAARR
jgi:transcriptional regulator with XRE-family HTH domain